MIKATFKNIGPINKAELELGDLTIIAGQNNTGKTYLTYILYGFLDFWINSRFPWFGKYKEKMLKIAKQMETTGSAIINLKEYKEIRDWLVKEVSAFFSNEIIHQFFSAPKSEFENASFLLEEINQIIPKDSSVSSIRSAKAKVFMQSSLKDENIIFELVDPEDIPLEKIARGVRFLFEKIIQNSSLNPFISSAERFGISLFYKELDFTKSSLVGALQDLSNENRDTDPFELLEQQSARYAVPIKHDIDFTRDLSTIQKEKSELMANEVRLIENAIGGYYRIVKGEVLFISKRRGENRFVIPMYLASSSVRGLCNLYFYLKHLAEPGQIYIIDEPESHLSPANQILMARLLVRCVNKGIKILITTHSDYIIKEIDNLIMLHGNFKQKKEFLQRYKKDYTESDCLDPNSVKSYICENGGLTPCRINKKGIDKMAVFDDAIDNINQITAELNMYTDEQQDD